MLMSLSCLKKKLTSMKKLMIIVVIGILASCNGKDSTNEVREKIAGKRKEIRQLKDEIRKLEEKLAEMDTSRFDSSNLTPVEIKTINSIPFNHYIEVNGTVNAVEEAYISAEMNGQIDKIHVDEGQKVYKGQLLISLNTDVTRSSIEEVKTNLELQEKLYQKQKELWEQKIGSELDYLQAKNRYEATEARLKTMQEQLDMSRVYAPFSGLVEEIYRKEGELAVPGVQLIQMVDLNRMKIIAQVSEKYIGKVNEGEKVVVEFPAFPGEKFEVPIYRIGSVINIQSRTFDIELRIDNKNNKLKPNIISTVRINDFSTDSALVVPSIIIKNDRRGSYIYIIEKENNLNVAKKTYVETGRSYHDETMITKGLKPGEEVIVSGYNQVSNGTPVIVK